MTAGPDLDMRVAEALGWSYKERTMADIKYPDGHRVVQGAAYELWDRAGNIQGIGKSYESARCFFTEEAECADFLKDAFAQLNIAYTIHHAGDEVTVSTSIKNQKFEVSADDERTALAIFALELDAAGVCLQVPLTVPPLKMWPGTVD